MDGLGSWLVVVLPVLFLVQAILSIAPFLWLRWGGFSNLAVLVEGCLWVVGVGLVTGFVVRLRNGFFWVRGLAASCFVVAGVPVLYIARTLLEDWEGAAPGFAPSGIFVGLTSIGLLFVGFKLGKISPEVSAAEGLGGVRVPAALAVAFFGLSVILRGAASSPPISWPFILGFQSSRMFWSGLAGLLEVVAGSVCVVLSVVWFRGHRLFSRPAVAMLGFFSFSWGSRCLSLAGLHGGVLGGDGGVDMAIDMATTASTASLGLGLVAFSVILFIVTYLGYGNWSGADRGVNGVEDVRDVRVVARDAIQDLKEIDLDSSLEAEVLENLVGGRKSTEELVGLIYDTAKGTGDYPAYYMRVRRATRSLEEKGLVSTALLGREKPYRLTRHALDKLLAMKDNRIEPCLVPVLDRVLYLALGVLVAVTWAWAMIGHGQQVLFYLSLTTVFLTGLAISRFLETLGKVM